MLMGACSCGYYAGGCSCCIWACVGQLGVRWGCATHEANWVLSAPNVRANVVFLSSVLLNIVAGLRCLHCLHLHRGRAVRQAAAGAEAVGVASARPPPAGSRQPAAALPCYWQPLNCKRPSARSAAARCKPTASLRSVAPWTPGAHLSNVCVLKKSDRSSPCPLVLCCLRWHAVEACKCSSTCDMTTTS